MHAGGYHTPPGNWADISDAVAAAVAGTRIHEPDEPLPRPDHHNAHPHIRVTNESSLAATHRLGNDTALLVFASARKPGGGFRTGARAQEEDIARACALHACLEAAPEFYTRHRSEPDLRYSDRIIHSPGVPVFRDDTDALLEHPYRVGMLTAAAPNLRAILDNQPDLAPTVPAVLRRCAHRLLQVAAAHRYRSLVLGAWGCGVFGNNPAVVAESFDAALRRVEAFDRVTFAVLDTAPGTPTHHCFTHAFTGTVPPPALSPIPRWG